MTHEELFKLRPGELLEDVLYDISIYCLVLINDKTTIEFLHLHDFYISRYSLNFLTQHKHYFKLLK